MRGVWSEHQRSLQFCVKIEKVAGTEEETRGQETLSGHRRKSATRMSDVFKIPNSSQKLFKIRNNEAKGTSVVGHCYWKVGLSRGHRREECKSRAGTEQAAVVNAAPMDLT
jgi:hypothetical protein